MKMKKVQNVILGAMTTFVMCSGVTYGSSLGAPKNDFGMSSMSSGFNKRSSFRMSSMNSGFIERSNPGMSLINSSFAKRSNFRMVSTTYGLTRPQLQWELQKNGLTVERASLSQLHMGAALF